MRHGSRVTGMVVACPAAAGGVSRLCSCFGRRPRARVCLCGRYPQRFKHIKPPTRTRAAGKAMMRVQRSCSLNPPPADEKMFGASHQPAAMPIPYTPPPTTTTAAATPPPIAAALESELSEPDDDSKDAAVVSVDGDTVDGVFGSGMSDVGLWVGVNVGASVHQTHAPPLQYASEQQSAPLENVNWHSMSVALKTFSGRQETSGMCCVLLVAYSCPYKVQYVSMPKS